MADLRSVRLVWRRPLSVFADGGNGCRVEPIVPLAAWALYSVTALGEDAPRRHHALR